MGEASVYLHNLRLVPLEISVRLQVVENCRHKLQPVAAATHLPAVGGEIDQPISNMEGTGVTTT